MLQEFHSILKKLPITSVQFVDNFILAGVGGSILIFHSSNFSELKDIINVLDNGTIHGIFPNEDNSKIFVYGGRYIAVLKADLYSYNSCFRLINKWRVGDWIVSCQWVEDDTQVATLSAYNVLSFWDAQSGTILAHAVCTEKCYIFSATILSSRWVDTVVIAGTVFQQIIIWAVAEDSYQEKQVLHRLTGHKGIIFSIRFDERSHLLSSTSDDRTVRVWSVSSPNGKLLTAEDWRNVSLNLAFTIFGHSARVWQSYILLDKKIVSSGEDSLLCLWDSSGKCIYQQETHQGAGVWCLSVSESQSLIVTGGADGGINLWPLNPARVSQHKLPPLPSTPRCIVLLNNRNVLTVTDIGELLLFENQSWSLVYTDTRFSSYCLLELSPSRELIGLASINGYIVVIKSSDFTKVIDTKITEGRIFSLHWLSEDTLLSCCDAGNLTIWKVLKQGLKEVGKTYLPTCKERWTTCAVALGEVVIYGDRMGNVHSSPMYHHLGDLADSVKTIEHAHNRLGVCSLNIIDGYIWSTGRNGTLKQFKMLNVQLTLISCIKLPIDWAAKILSHHNLGPIVICFHQSNVVLWSIQERRKLTTLQCGGGHRSWSFLDDAEVFYFTFLKEKTAYLFQFSVLQLYKPILMEGFHIREINSIKKITNSWIVSGGEDGSVRISNFKNNKWSTPVVTHSHLSSVRSVNVFASDQHLLLFSAGGRAQIKAWRINLDSSNLTPVSLVEVSSVMLRDERQAGHWLNSTPLSDPETRYMDLHSVLLDDSTVHLLAACSDGFLRVFHLDSSYSSLSLKNCVKSGEHCMLRVTSFQCQNTERVVVTTATDGSLTFWILSHPSNDIIEFGKKYIHQCGVNGLSVEVIDEGCGRVLVATGGDDNALVVCCYQINVSPLSAHTVATWSSSTLHTSVITGVQIVGKWILCAGGDQRVTLLSWTFDDDQLAVDLSAQHCCSVPDIKGLAILHSKKEELILCVYGLGFEVLDLKTE